MFSRVVVIVPQAIHRATNREYPQPPVSKGTPKKGKTVVQPETVNYGDNP
jgi:hypothetical protein